MMQISQKHPWPEMKSSWLVNCSNSSGAEKVCFTPCVVLGTCQDKVTKKDIGTYECLFWQDQLLKAVKDILLCAGPA